MRGQGSRLDR